MSTRRPVLLSRAKPLLGKTHDRNIKVEANLDNYTNFVSINKEIEILGEKLRGIMLEDEA